MDGFSRNTLAPLLLALAAAGSVAAQDRDSAAQPDAGAAAERAADAAAAQQAGAEERPNDASPEQGSETADDRQADSSAEPEADAASAAASDGAPPADGELLFGNMTLDGKTGRVEFTDLRIEMGDATIEADRASANELNYDQSEWRLEGDVRFTVGSVRVEGREAAFSFRGDQLQRFVLEGDPATFEDRTSEAERAARGGADRLAYDRAEGEISLTGNAWLSVGGNEMIGCDWIYAIEEEQFRSGSTECDRGFRTRVPSVEGSAAEDPPQPR